MSTQRQLITVETEGLNVSKIVWRRFHRQMPGLVERILDENRELCDAGRILPVGTEFFIPLDNLPNEPELAQITLW